MINADCLWIQSLSFLSVTIRSHVYLGSAALAAETLLAGAPTYSELANVFSTMLLTSKPEVLC